MSNWLLPSHRCEASGRCESFTEALEPELIKLTQATERSGSLWPYLLPMLSFLLLVDLPGRVGLSGEDYALPLLGLRVLVPLAMLV